MLAYRQGHPGCWDNKRWVAAQRLIRHARDEGSEGHHHGPHLAHLRRSLAWPVLGHLIAPSPCPPATRGPGRR
jgi:hypothetical protein